jgi:hypothetical protein
MRHYFIRGKYITSVKPSTVLVHGIKTIPWGVAFFCPFCSEIWALATIDDRETGIQGRPCDRHTPYSPSRGVSGSIWISWDEEWNNDLPVELLIREFLLHYDVSQSYGEIKDGLYTEMTIA